MKLIFYFCFINRESALRLLEFFNKKRAANNSDSLDLIIDPNKN